MISKMSNSLWFTNKAFHQQKIRTYEYVFHKKIIYYFIQLSENFIGRKHMVQSQKNVMHKWFVSIDFVCVVALNPNVYIFPWLHAFIFFLIIFHGKKKTIIKQKGMSINIVIIILLIGKIGIHDVCSTIYL